MENELKHYGVKGMKWGVRHDRVSNAAKKGSRAVTSALSKIGSVTIGKLKSTSANGRALVRTFRSSSSVSPVSEKELSSKISKRGERLRERALRPGSSTKDVTKAMNYLSNDELQNQIRRQTLINEYKSISGTGSKRQSQSANFGYRIRSGAAKGIGSGIEKVTSKAVSGGLSPVTSWAGQRAANKAADFLSKHANADPSAVAAATRAAKNAFSGNDSSDDKKKKDD